MTAEQLRYQYEQDLMDLQSNCPHGKSEWMENQFATGHTTGVVKVCVNCEKILESK